MYLFFLLFLIYDLLFIRAVSSYYSSCFIFLLSFAWVCYATVSIFLVCMFSRHCLCLMVVLHAVISLYFSTQLSFSITYLPLSVRYMVFMLLLIFFYYYFWCCDIFIFRSPHSLPAYCCSLYLLRYPSLFVSTSTYCSKAVVLGYFRTCKRWNLTLVYYNSVLSWLGTNVIYSTPFLPVNCLIGLC